MLLSRRFALGALGTALVVLAGCAQQNQAPVNTRPSNVTTRQRAALTGDTTTNKPAVAAQNNNDLRKILADQIRKAAAERNANADDGTARTRPSPTNKAPKAKGEVSRTMGNPGTTNAPANARKGAIARAKIKPADQVVSSGRSNTNSAPAGTPQRQ